QHPGDLPQLSVLRFAPRRGGPEGRRQAGDPGACPAAEAVVGGLYRLEGTRVRPAGGRRAGGGRGLRRRGRQDSVRRLDRPDRPAPAQGRPHAAGPGFRVDEGFDRERRRPVIALVLAMALAPGDPSYAELSRKQGLGVADRLMREGKYLEAAV